ncbi:hypothetical protein EBZ39_14415 [bacterium]|nr:hypothetical protein [bacterium]
MKLSKTLTTEEEKNAIARYIYFAHKITIKSKCVMKQHQSQKIKLNAKAIDDLIEINKLSSLIKTELLWKWFEKTPEDKIL